MGGRARMRVGGEVRVVRRLIGGRREDCPMVSTNARYRQGRAESVPTLRLHLEALW